MNGSLKVAQGIVLLSFLGMVLSSCGGSQTTLSSTTASGTTGTGNTPASSSTESVEDQEKNATIPSGYSASDLFVTVPDTIDFLNFTSQTGSWADRCNFTSSSVTNDLTCNVEVNELALFNDGIKFQYNVPANSCKYIATYPYWYWNYEVGYGPKDVNVVVTKDVSGAVVTSTCTVDGVSFTPCVNNPAQPTVANDVEVVIADEIKVNCSYDKSVDDGGVNCCFGKYRLRTTIITPDSTASTDESGKEWGGNVTACMGGPGRTSWEKLTAAGYPRYVIEKMTPDVPRTKIIQIQPTINKAPGSGSNIAISNFFTVGNHNHSGYGAVSGVVNSIYPYYVDPVSDRSGDRISDSTSIRAGSPFYLFDCLDEAFEVNFRVRMMVQEWDTVAALLTYKGNGSLVVSPDEPGTAPASCPGLTGDACNQLSDADNFVDGQSSGSYSNSFPANRGSYFPSHTYE